jgi:protein-S-isoprenylcysteine O-methyltransferase Ste14
MDVGVVFMLFGETIFFESILLLGFTMFIFLSFHLFVIGYEEPTLRRTFGKAYEQYCKSVPRWLPLHFYSPHQVQKDKDSDCV